MNQDVIKLMDRFLDIEVPYKTKGIEHHLKKDKSIKVLDIGCGMGNIPMHLASKFKLEYSGIDICNKSIKIFNKKIKAANLPFKTTQANANNYTPTQRYDQIWILGNTLFHLYEPEEIIKKYLKYTDQLIVSMFKDTEDYHQRLIQFNSEIVYTDIKGDIPFYVDSSKDSNKNYTTTIKFKNKNEYVYPFSSHGLQNFKNLIPKGHNVTIVDAKTGLSITKDSIELIGSIQ